MTKEAISLESRILAEYRNVASWTGNSLSILGFFWAISNNYQSEAVRVGACIFGCTLSITFNMFTLYVHAPLIHGRIATLFNAIFILNLIPSIFWILIFFLSEEYKVSQNKN